MAGSQGGGVMDSILGVNQSQDSYITQSQLGPLLDAWYAKKQPLQQSEAAPNKNTYTASYGDTGSTQQAAGASTQQAPGSQPQQQQDYGWRPSPFGYGGMQTPFSGYGQMAQYGGGYGYGGMGGYGNYMNSYSPFGGGMGYGQMYNPFSMY